MYQVPCHCVIFLKQGLQEHRFLLHETYCVSGFVPVPSVEEHIDFRTEPCVYVGGIEAQCSDRRLVVEIHACPYKTRGLVCAVSSASLMVL